MCTGDAGIAFRMERQLGSILIEASYKGRINKPFKCRLCKVKIQFNCDSHNLRKLKKDSLSFSLSIKSSSMRRWSMATAESVKFFVVRFSKLSWNVGLIPTWRTYPPKSHFNGIIGNGDVGSRRKGRISEGYDGDSKMIRPTTMIRSTER